MPAAAQTAGATEGDDRQRRAEGHGGRRGAAPRHHPPQRRDLAPRAVPQADPERLDVNREGVDAVSSSAAAKGVRNPLDFIYDAFDPGVTQPHHASRSARRP